MDMREESRPYFAYATNYLIDTQNSVIMDVKATRAIRQAEVGASQKMLDRTEKRFGIKPDGIAADAAYGSAENIGWLVKKTGGTYKYRALKADCQACPSKHRCCPNMDFRAVKREPQEDARDRPVSAKDEGPQDIA